MIRCPIRDCTICYLVDAEWQRHLDQALSLLKEEPRHEHRSARPTQGHTAPTDH
jgi:hypothetical protein